MLLSSSELPLDTLTNYGLAGVVLSILLTFGWLTIKHERAECSRRETDSAKRLADAQGQLQSLNELIREKYVKGLEDAYHATAEAHDLIVILRDELRQRPR